MYKPNPLSKAFRAPDPNVVMLGLGDFDHQVLIGPFQSDFRRMHPAFVPKGLSLDGGWLYATFRDAEDNIFSCLRKLSGYWTGPLSIFTNMDGDSLQLDPRCLTSHVGQLDIELADDRITWCSGLNQLDAERSLSVEHDGGVCSWREGQILDIRGEMLQPGMQWFDAHPDGGFYALHPHRASGTIFGRPVTGWFGFDFIYHPPHRPWHVGPYPTRLEVAYHTIFNAYDDGSVEVGMMCYGLEGWCFAFISDGKNLIHCTREIDIAVIERMDGYPHEILHHFDGVTYRWQADPKGRLLGAASLFNGTYRASEGRCQRVGDTRRIVSGNGWVDYFSDGRGADKIVGRI